MYCAVAGVAVLLLTLGMAAVLVSEVSEACTLVNRGPGSRKSQQRAHEKRKQKKRKEFLTVPGCKKFAEQVKVKMARIVSFQLETTSVTFGNAAGFNRMQSDLLNKKVREMRQELEGGGLCKPNGPKGAAGTLLLELGKTLYSEERFDFTQMEMVWTEETKLVLTLEDNWGMKMEVEIAVAYATENKFGQKNQLRE